MDFNYYPRAERSGFGLNTLKNQFSPSLTNSEREALSESSPAGMTIDKSRMLLNGGVSIHVYHRTGLMLMFEIQLNHGLSGYSRELGFVFEHVVGAGYAY